MNQTSSNGIKLNYQHHEKSPEQENLSQQDSPFFPECLISWSYPVTISRVFQQGSGKQQVFGIFDSWDYFLRHHFW